MHKTLLVLLVLLARTVSAQHIYSLNDDKSFTDSISSVIENTESDSIKCLNYLKLSITYLRNKDLNLSNFYLQKANQLAANYESLKSLAISHNATSYLLKRDFNQYTAQLLLANEKLKKYDVSYIYAHRASIFKSLAVINQVKQNETESMSLLIKQAIPLAKKSNDYEVLCNIYKTIAIILMNNNDRGKADNYLNLAVKYIEMARIKSPSLQESKLEVYIVNAENLCELNRLTEAKNLLDKAYSILKNYPKSNLNAIYYYSRGLYYFKLKEYAKSINNYDRGIENSMLNNDLTSYYRLSFAKYKSLRNLKKYKEARDILISLVENNKLFVIDKKINYKEIIEVCQLIGDYKNGYKYSIKYIHLTDSIYDTNTRKEIAELEAKYNAAEKEKKINQLETQKQKALLVSEKNKFIYQLSGLISVVLVLIILFLWKSYKSQRNLTLEKEKNYNQSIAVLNHEKELEKMQAMINGEEEERKRIARDLHDGIGSRLSALKLKLTHAINENHLPNSKSLVDLLNLSISELRQVAYNLIPETLLKLGLENAISDLCYSLSSTTVSIHFHANQISETISVSNQIAIYRIVQELVNNSLKHSNCSEIIVSCSQNTNLFLITVEDNGTGFNENQIANFTGLGLKNIKNRIDLLNGKIEIESSPNEGCCFNIELYLT